MKKILISVLAIVMIISMAIPAVAIAKSGEDWETQVPALAKESSVVIRSAEDAMELSEDVQALMADAKAKLKKACPKGFAFEYFCYVETKDAASVTVAPIDHYEIVFMQYINGEWVELEHTVNQDVTITVDGIVEAPIAVFVKKNIEDSNAGAGLASPKAKRARLLPGLADESSVLLYSTEDVLKLSGDVHKLMAEAKAKLKDACPAGFAVKYFCYGEIVGNESSAPMVLKPIDHDEIQVMQYVDGAWMELKATVNEDGTVTVEGVAEGPIAIFTK